MKKTAHVSNCRAHNTYYVQKEDGLRRTKKLDYNIFLIKETFIKLKNLYQADTIDRHIMPSGIPALTCVSDEDQTAQCVELEVKHSEMINDCSR